jgi:hypothetical protein
VALEYLAPTSIVSSSQWTAEDLTWIDDPWLTPNDETDYMNSFQVAAPIVIRLRFAPAVGVPSTTLDIGGAYFRVKLVDDIAVFPATIQVFFLNTFIATATHSISNIDGLWHNYAVLFPRTLSITETKSLEAVLTVTSNGTTRVRLTTTAIIINTEAPVSQFDAEDAYIGHGLRTRLCSICGFPFRETELTYRNGKLVCVVAGPKAFPCYDDEGYKESVITTPFNLGPRPDSGPFKNNPNS